MLRSRRATPDARTATIGSSAPPTPNGSLILIGATAKPWAGSALAFSGRAGLGSIVGGVTFAVAPQKTGPAVGPLRLRARELVASCGGRGYHPSQAVSVGYRASLLPTVFEKLAQRAGSLNVSGAA